MPTSVQFEGGRLEQLKGYSTWSFVGAELLLDELKGKTRNEPGQWSLTRIQDDELITLALVTNLSERFGQVFVESIAFWNQLIGETPRAPTVFDTDTNIASVYPSCETTPAFVVPAGVPFKILVVTQVGQVSNSAAAGSGGPCGFVGSRTQNVGKLTINENSINGLFNAGTLADVIKHEVGHILGVGNLWRHFSVISDRCISFPCSTTPQYVGAHGLEGFNDLGGTGVLRIENGNEGTANTHWKESVFNNELMVSSGCAVSLLLLLLLLMRVCLYRLASWTLGRILYR